MMTRDMQRTLTLVVAVAGPFVWNEISYSQETLRPVMPGDAEVRDVLNKKPHDYGLFVAKSLAVASADELQQLKHHSNWGISLHAAWEQWVDDRRQLSGKYSDAAARAGAVRWLGFVEGKLDVRLPTDWCNTVSAPKVMHTPRRFGSDPNNTDSFMFEEITSSRPQQVEILPGLYADAGTLGKLVQETTILELEKGGRRIRIPLGKLNNVTDDTGAFRKGGAIEWKSYADHQYVVFHNRWSNNDYNIARIPKGADEPDWFTAGGSGYYYPAIAPQIRHVDLVVAGKTLLIFTCSDSLASVEGFDLDSGKAIAKFHSAIW